MTPLEKLRQSRVFFFHCQAQQTVPVQELLPGLKNDQAFPSGRKTARGKRAGCRKDLFYRKMLF